MWHHPQVSKIYVAQFGGGGRGGAEKLSDCKSRTVWRERDIKYTRLQGGNFPVVHNKSLWQPVQCFVAYYSRFAAGILWGPPLNSHKNVSCNLLAGVYSEVSRPCPSPPGRITVFKTKITELWHNAFTSPKLTVGGTVKLLWTLVVQCSCAVCAANVAHWNQ